MNKRGAVRPQERHGRFFPPPLGLQALQANATHIEIRRAPVTSILGNLCFSGAVAPQLLILFLFAWEKKTNFH